MTLAAYAVFGTSRHLVAAASSAAAVLFCGGLFLVAGLLRLGFLAQFLSRPVMEGFVFGLAIFVTVSQLPKLGIKKGSGTRLSSSCTCSHIWATPAPHSFAVGAGARAAVRG